MDWNLTHTKMKIEHKQDTVQVNKKSQYSTVITQ